MALLLRLKPLFIALFVSATVMGCGSATGIGGASDGSGAAASLVYEQNVTAYYSTMQNLMLDVVYEPGAEPYVATLRSGASLWQITVDNLDALFNRRALKPTFFVPTTLAQMRVLPVQNRSEWTVNNIYDLASENQISSSTATTGQFMLIFLKGFYTDGSTVQPNVLGVQITGTTIIAIFKDVVKAQALSPSSQTLRYVEQSTIVHELGHALGLVNHGVPQSSAHHDAAHGAHCTNPDCVMFWKNEGAADYINFISHRIESGNNVMFGDECTADTAAFAP